MAYPRRWQTWAAATALAAAYLAVSLPGAGSATLSTVLSNTVGYFGFALFPRALATFLRRLGGAADLARAEATAAGRRVERDRQRWMLHDHATIMRMLADPGIDPTLAELLRRQAAVGANRVRSFLGSEAATSGSGSSSGSGSGEPPTRLTALLAVAVAANADLPIDPSVELAAGVELDPTVAAAMADAVTTLLHTVRRHAYAGSVVLHADHDDGTWEVLVADDGVGFDPDTVPFGFGLREQVIRQLAGHAVTVTIESAPGDGTRVTLSGSAGV